MQKKSKLSEFNKNKYLSFCDFVGIIEIDSQVAQIYGNVKNQLQSEGKLIPKNDMWIAATAIANQLTLILWQTFSKHKRLEFLFIEL